MLFQDTVFWIVQQRSFNTFTFKVQVLHVYASCFAHHQQRHKVILVNAVLKEQLCWTEYNALTYFQVFQLKATLRLSEGVQS